MSLLVWNCHGFGNLHTGKELEELIQAKDPTVVFLAETWTDKARLDQIQHYINLEHKRVVERSNQGGGLVLFWKSIINLTVKDMSKYHIDAFINKNTDEECPKTCRRHTAWTKLQRLNSHPNVPWLCARDFNEILKQEEKQGGTLCSHNQMQQFREVLNECCFLDLGFVGPKFTSSRHYTDGHSIWERLDQGLVTNNWIIKFPSTQVQHLRCDSSNHCPLLINPTGLLIKVKKISV